MRTEADAARAASQLVRPGQTLPVRVRAEQPSKAIVFAVDEGILQLTSYATPDPCGHCWATGPWRWTPISISTC